MGLIIAYILFILNLLWLIPIIYPVYFLKLIPIVSIRKSVDGFLVWIGEIWIQNNYRISQILFGVQFEVHSVDWAHLSTNGRYMLVCNHQSWSDIYIIQSVLNRKIPLIRFFIKEQLKYVPILGTAWLALDFPFVKRSSKKDLIKNPELAHQDLQNVRNVCKKFIGYPFSILNFVEGTRRTPEKVAKLAKKNPYNHLLRAHSSGISVVSTALKNELDGYIDLTIVYPKENPSFLDLMSGEIKKVKVFIHFIPSKDIPMEENENLAPLSKAMKRWIDERWRQKDELLSREKQTNHVS